ncbi:DUF1190 domain-containing protein [Pseudomonas sp. 5P_5.1_Bac1]|uniref:DUF1190 domain-containing protein n=1 Tax=Pseudomonas sp. 5P_5.1_Bac1 TaxID=2971616 RepID=UPI0021C72FA5|nr:DUF1190 domain-containing protein [Pseudomonas sp. 5P_5.1_Bac1]MCU1720415.1 DUF1190 domain-containing protein [Pseudomonas sp. 5P_5.1_Bac1]
MRARSSAKLLLASALPLAISGCSDPEQTVTYSLKSNFKNVQACVDASFPADVCSDAYIQAMVDHRQVAPTYDDRAACDADFIEGYCQPTSDGKYMPQLAGFELAMSGDMPKDQMEQVQQQAQQQAAQSGGSGIGNGVAAAATGALAGMLIGQAMSNRSAPRYQSQPVYQSRDSRGAYQTSTLSKQIEQGKTFSRSTQARRDDNGSGGGYSGSTLGRSLGTSNSRSASSSSYNSNVGSTISRGGFGQQATARSGWSGKRSSGYSFGG